MTIDNQDGNFVLIQKGEASKSQHEELRHIRFGNHSLDKQFERDIELISLAIVQSGPSEQDKIKADTLLKSMLLLFFGRVCYRHVSDQRFYPFSTLNSYFKNSTLTQFPIAAILLHGSRVLIEFPSEIASELINWLIIDKSGWRYLATHGISALTEPEVIAKNYQDIQPKSPLRKYLKEEKVSGTYAAINLLSNSISGLMSNAYFNLSSSTHSQNKMDTAEHYGVDLALGGVGNQHSVSKKIIQNDGEHGHLYINVYQGQTPQSGILLGIEQSAPGKPDQYGGKHDLSVTDKAYSASGGDLFCKKLVVPKIHQKDYCGLGFLPFANYYNNFWNFIPEDAFPLVKSSFEKCKCLLTLLPQEKSIAFFVDIVTTSGGASQEDFNILFARYFQEIPQVKIKINNQSNALDHLKTLQQHFQRLKIEHQQLEISLKTNLSNMTAEMQLQINTIKNQQLEELTAHTEQLQNLIIEKNNSEKYNQELSSKLTNLCEQIDELRKDKHVLLLVNRAYSFMQLVLNQMGWFANKSQKKNILLALQKKIQADGINTEQVTFLLKNFISVSLMNRYYFKTETHTAKACLICLSLPEYQSLTELLEIDNTIPYKDLLSLVSNHETKKEYFFSAKYKNNLYKLYQEKGTKNHQIDESKLNLATQQIIYQPKFIQK